MTGDRYHHGDLANTLRHVGADLLAERGPGGFSLREVARRAGVSHAAPAHHFGTAEGLLTEIAVEAFGHLRAAFAAVAATTTDPLERVVAQGRAYVEIGRQFPGHCAVAFRYDLVDDTDPRYQEAGILAYAELLDTIAAIRDTYRPELDVEAGARLCWSTMQGLVTLYPNMVRIAETSGDAAPPPAGALAEQLGRLLVTGLLGTWPAAGTPPA